MLDIDLAVSIKRLSVAFVPLMLGIILHEVAHGWAALKRGDPTAAMLGRLTINPVPHIDPVGLFVFVLTSLTGPAFCCRAPSSSAGPSRCPSIPGTSETS